VGALVYDKELDGFARRYLVTGTEPFSSADVAKRYEEVRFRVANVLLRHQGVAFRVFGENIPLAVLIDLFGVRGVEALLEQKALQFVLWTSMVTFFVDDMPDLKLNPLQSGYHTSLVHADPEESAASGLKWLKNQPPRKERRRLIRKITEAYKTIPRSLAEHAARFGHEGYEANMFEPLGLPRAKELGDLNKAEREKLATFGDECMELSILSANQYDTLDSYNLAVLNRVEFDNLRHARAIEELMDVLFKVEKVPRFDELIREGLIDISQVPDIRASSDSIKFRDWIAAISGAVDAETITKEYISAIIRGKSRLDEGGLKLLRTTVVLVLHAIAGFTLSPSIGAATSTAIGLLDAYVLSAISKGWSPRHFFEKDIERIMRGEQGR